MKKLIAVLLFVFATLSLANPIDDKCPQHAPYGAPISKIPTTQGQYLCRVGYAAHYNYNTKVSEYVVERIVKQNLSGGQKRGDDFREDPEVPVQFRSTLKDYQGSGYDRGHMAPAADFPYSAQAMSESFFLTNMMPQVPGNNRGIWKYTETYTRAWVEAYGEALVVTGVIYSQPLPDMGNGVKVPSHIYKVVVVPSIGKSISFLFPNQKLPVEDLPKYIVSIAEIEQYTGLQIMPKLPVQNNSIKTQRANFKEWVGQ